MSRRRESLQAVYRKSISNCCSGRSAGAGVFDYFLRYDGRIDRFAFLVTSNGSSSSLTEVRANILGSPATSQWYFVCGGYDGTNLWISVNAGSRDVTPFSADIFDSNSALWVGGSSYSTSYLNGAMDEVVLYKRSLPQNEIAWLYNNGLGRSYADLSASPPPSTAKTFSYDPNHKHAVTSLSTGEGYTYDANGNMITRVENGQTYTQTFEVAKTL